VEEIIRRQHKIQERRKSVESDWKKRKYVSGNGIISISTDLDFQSFISSTKFPNVNSNQFKGLTHFSTFR